jgi:hypothetical protein
VICFRLADQRLCESELDLLELSLELRDPLVRLGERGAEPRARPKSAAGPIRERLERFPPRLPA